MPRKSGVRIQKRGKIWWISYHLNGERVRESLGTESKKIALRLRDEKEEDLPWGQVIAMARFVAGSCDSAPMSCHPGSWISSDPASVTRLPPGSSN